MNFPKPSVGRLPNDRLDYSAITTRKPLKLPKGARMVVWTVTNVEEWDPTQTMPRTVLTPPAGGSPMPDIPNWCWHEYGNRVGFWRLLQVYDEFKIPGVMNINGVAVNAFPDIVKACVDRNWEFVGHGYTQRNMQKVENERADVRKCIEVLEKATGKRPRGWLGPGLTETWETPDILAEEGYDYVADWVLDDQPVWMKTRGKPILNIPYTQECNDVAMMLIQHHKASEFYERAMDQFEQIYKDAKGSARVMAISVHPYIMGAPHRAKYFRQIFQKIRKKKDVLFWTGAQIADWFKKAGPAGAVIHTLSWPGLTRPSTSCFIEMKSWMPGTRPGMTTESACKWPQQKSPTRRPSPSRRRKCISTSAPCVSWRTSPSSSRPAGRARFTMTRAG